MYLILIDLLELRLGTSPAARARSPARVGPHRRLGLCRARGVPGALLPWGKRGARLTGASTRPPWPGAREQPTVIVMASRPGEGSGDGDRGVDAAS